jgi:ABC-2 type transport system ATP-binding protein
MRLIGLVPQEVNFNMFEKPLDILVNYAGFYGMPRAQALVARRGRAEGGRAVGQGAPMSAHPVRRHEAPD